MPVNISWSKFQEKITNALDSSFLYSEYNLVSAGCVLHVEYMLYICNYVRESKRKLGILYNIRAKTPCCAEGFHKDELSSSVFYMVHIVWTPLCEMCAGKSACHHTFVHCKKGERFSSPQPGCH